MEMENIFDKQDHLFSNLFKNINLEWDLIDYLYINLEKENYETFLLDLEIALTINANGEYI
jgi:hypothetical protein